MDFNFLFSDPEEQLASDIRIADDELYELGKCPVHKKKASVSYDCDEHGSYAYVTRYCCQEFAIKVAETLEKTRRFVRVEIE